MMCLMGKLLSCVVKPRIEAASGSLQIELKGLEVLNSITYQRFRGSLLKKRKGDRFMIISLNRQLARPTIQCNGTKSVNEWLNE